MARRLVLLQLGALGLVLAGLAPWIEGVSGYDLARAVGEVGGDVDGLPPAWVGYAWYLLPVLGFVAWLGLYVPRQPARRLCLVVGALAVVFAVVFAIVALSAGASLGWGVAVALLGGVLLLVAALPRS